jgi:hypothetical protein
VTPQIPATVAALLERTADHLDRWGLWKRDPYDMDGWRAGTVDPRRTAVCADAAISIVGGWLPSLTGPDIEESPAAAVARRTFADWLITSGLARRVCHHQPAVTCGDVSCFDVTDTIGGWNDLDNRTLDQVTAALRECAATLLPRPAIEAPKEASR